MALWAAQRVSICLLLQLDFQLSSPVFWFDMCVTRCFAGYASKWLDYLDPLIEQKITVTGLSMIETDGPYGGGLCNGHNHTHHKGLLDSQYWQMRLQSEQYHKMRRLGVFVNAPDRYFQQGANKMMFYGERTNAPPATINCYPGFL